MEIKADIPKIPALVSVPVKYISYVKGSSFVIIWKEYPEIWEAPHHQTLSLHTWWIYHQISLFFELQLLLLNWICKSLSHFSSMEHFDMKTEVDDLCVFSLILCVRFSSKKSASSELWTSVHLKWMERIMLHECYLECGDFWFPSHWLYLTHAWTLQRNLTNV